MSASSIQIPCVKGKCCRPSTSTEFDSTHPSELVGIISPDEFQASIARINASLQRPKWTYRVQTAGRILIVLGLIALIFSGVKYFRMKHHYHEEHEHHHNHHTALPADYIATVTGVSDPTSDVDISLPMAWKDSDKSPMEKVDESENDGPTADASIARIEKVDDDDDDDENDHHHHHHHHEGVDGDKKHHKKHGKCIKHLFHSGLITLIAGFALCRWMAGRKMRQLVTRVVPAVCAEHHLYTSSSRAVPVSWSLDEKSVCNYMCKNNLLKLTLDLHSLVPLNRVQAKPNNAAEKEQMMAGSAYVPLNTNEA